MRKKRDPKTFSPAEAAVARRAMRAWLEATKRAEARGLTAKEIKREEEDEDSELWDDIVEITLRLQRSEEVS